MLKDMTQEMSKPEELAEEIAVAYERFCRSTAVLTEEVAGYAPVEGMMTVAQQVAHTARVIDWFVEGVFRAEGFDMNFEEQIRMVLAVERLGEARAWLERAVGAAVAKLRSCTMEELEELLPEGPVLGGMPRRAMVSAIVDHTAHHRGALTVYARLKGMTAPDPYGG